MRSPEAVWLVPQLDIGPPQAHRPAAGAPREGKGVRGLPGITRFSITTHSIKYAVHTNGVNIKTHIWK